MLAAANEDVGCGRDLYRGARGVHVVYPHLARHHGPQRGRAVGKVSPFYQQVVQAYFLGLSVHGDHYTRVGCLVCTPRKCCRETAAEMSSSEEETLWPRWAVRHARSAHC